MSKCKRREGKKQNGEGLNNYSLRPSWKEEKPTFSLRVKGQANEMARTDVSRLAQDPCVYPCATSLFSNRDQYFTAQQSVGDVACGLSDDTPGDGPMKQ